ncbi:hypothetical protein EYF80_063943 [Liparis tanakae]|uniref:Uncharacterized protein n=1 Tax=Liparis tanakae TaxID=230148 RepID=A0A4Z2EAZ7_9TELE|nr:hypothetical protein EYF80_063943 [Liparis tanakae]
MDISGCRSADLIVQPTIDEDECTSTCPVMIDKDQDSFVVGCGPWDICVGNNECTPFTRVCTVMGSTVIDFFNTVHAVPDLCAYTMLENFETQVSVDFQERHLEDVPYLTNMTVFMKAASKTINMGPGGVVWVSCSNRV